MEWSEALRRESFDAILIRQAVHHIPKVYKLTTEEIFEKTFLALVNNKIRAIERGFKFVFHFLQTLFNYVYLLSNVRIDTLSCSTTYSKASPRGEDFA